jgi:hypothetical protein
MSLSIVPLNVNMEINPLINYDELNTYNTVRCPKSILAQAYPSSSLSDSNFVVNIIPSSLNTVLSRKMYIKVTFIVPIVTSAGTLIENLYKDIPTLFIPRANPVSSVTSSLQLQLGTTVITQTINRYVDVLTRQYLDPENYNANLSTSPSQPDAYGKIASGTLAENETFKYKNPFGQFKDIVGNGTINRGSFPFTVVPVSTNNWNLVYEFCEPIYLSPLLYDKIYDEAKGLTQVTQYVLTYNLSNLSRAFLFADGTLTSPLFTATVTKANIKIDKAEALCSFANLPDILPLPTTIVYNYNALLWNSAIQSSAAADATVFNATVQTFVLNSIPSKILIWAKRSNGDLFGSDGHKYMDSYAYITKLSATIDNTSGIFASYTPFQLYSILGAANGYKGSWKEWSEITGSIITIDFNKNLGLSSNQAPGLTGQFSIQFSVDFKNLYKNAAGTAGVASSFELDYLVIYGNTMTIQNSNIQLSSGPLAPLDVISSESSGQSHMDHGRLYGGSFWGDVFEGAKRIPSFVSNLLSKSDKILKNIPALKQYAPQLEQIKGYANAAESVKDAFEGSGGGVTAGGVTGGKKMSKKQIKRQMEKY